MLDVTKKSLLTFKENFSLELLFFILSHPVTSKQPHKIIRSFWVTLYTYLLEYFLSILETFWFQIFGQSWGPEFLKHHANKSNDNNSILIKKKHRAFNSVFIWDHASFDSESISFFIGFCADLDLKVFVILKKLCTPSI